MALTLKGAEADTKSTSGSTLTDLMDKYSSDLSPAFTKETLEAIQKLAPQKDAGPHIPAVFKNAVMARQQALEEKNSEQEGSEFSAGNFGENKL